MLLIQGGVPVNLKELIEEKIKSVISSWNEKDIYAISFLVYFDELSNYKGIINFPELSVGYNTESECEGSSELSEERWNYAFWKQNNKPIINSEKSDMADSLLKWYSENGVVDIGVELEEQMYDSESNYIGKGPNGLIELLNLVSDVARKLQLEGYIKERFGHIPIIVHDLEYSWFIAEATKNANPHGEADTFLKAFDNGFED